MGSEHNRVQPMAKLIYKKPLLFVDKRSPFTNKLQKKDPSLSQRLQIEGRDNQEQMQGNFDCASPCYWDAVRPMRPSLQPPFKMSCSGLATL